MSQIEQDLRQFLAKHPEIEKCLQQSLINRRSLARYLIKEGIARASEFGALIATLRRYDFRRYPEEEMALFRKLKIQLKDNIIILDFEKDKGLVQELKKIINSTNYDKGDTLKMVLGTTSITLFLDEDKLPLISELAKGYKPRNKYLHISELSLLFPDTAIATKGILSYITREFYLNDILISELLTASQELLIYVKEEYVLKAYEIIKRLHNATLD
jgi:hypothetical protein